MSLALKQLLTYISIPVVVTFLGGSLSVFFSAAPRLRSSIQHFAAGLVFAAVSIGLLPEMLEKHELAGVVLGFSLGVALMLCVKWLARTRRVKLFKNAGRKFSLVFSAAVDYLVDGLLIGIGFILGARQGGLLTFALTIEGLVLAMAVASALTRTRSTRTRVVITSAIFGLLLAIGGIAGVVVFGRLAGFFHTVMLACGAAALIYLVTEELLVEAHDEHLPEDPVTVAVFFAGFLLLIGIEMSV